MLQGVLLILKIIGIIILVLFCLLLLFVCAVAFAPIKYHAALNYTEEKKSGEVYLSWFFHFATVQISYDLADMRSVRRIKILGIDPQKIGSFFQRHNRNEKQSHNKKYKETTSDKGNASNPGKQENVDKPEKEQVEGNQEEKQQEDKQKDQEEKEAPFRFDQKEQSTSFEVEYEEEFSTESHKMKAKKRRFSLSDFFKKSVYKLRGVCDTINDIPTRVRTFIAKPQESLQRFSESIHMLNEAGAGEVLKECWNRLLQLLRHYRVREGEGYFRFGTGDPASTGELTGLIYMILPASCGKISIDPQFTESVLDTELHIRGHIRIIHLLTAAWWAFRNKKLREVVNLISDLNNR